MVLTTTTIVRDYTGAIISKAVSTPGQAPVITTYPSAALTQAGLTVSPTTGQPVRMEEGERAVLEAVKAVKEHGGYSAFLEEKGYTQEGIKKSAEQIQAEMPISVSVSPVSAPVSTIPSPVAKGPGIISGMPTKLVKELFEETILKEKVKEAVEVGGIVSVLAGPKGAEYFAQQLKAREALIQAEPSITQTVKTIAQISRYFESQNWSFQVDQNALNSQLQSIKQQTNALEARRGSFWQELNKARNEQEANEIRTSFNAQVQSINQQIQSYTSTAQKLNERIEKFQTENLSTVQKIDAQINKIDVYNLGIKEQNLLSKAINTWGEAVESTRTIAAKGPVPSILEQEAQGIISRVGEIQKITEPIAMLGMPAYGLPGVAGKLTAKEIEPYLPSEVKETLPYATLATITGGSAGLLVFGGGLAGLAVAKGVFREGRIEQAIGKQSIYSLLPDVLQKTYETPAGFVGMGLLAITAKGKEKERAKQIRQFALTPTATKEQFAQALELGGFFAGSMATAKGLEMLAKSTVVAELKEEGKDIWRLMFGEQKKPFIVERLKLGVKSELLSERLYPYGQGKDYFATTEYMLEAEKKLGVDVLSISTPVSKGVSPETFRVGAGLRIPSPGIEFYPKLIPGQGLSVEQVAAYQEHLARYYAGLTPSLTPFTGRVSLDVYQGKDVTAYLASIGAERDWWAFAGRSLRQPIISTEKMVFKIGEPLTKEFPTLLTTTTITDKGIAESITGYGKPALRVVGSTLKDILVTQEKGMEVVWVEAWREVKPEMITKIAREAIPMKPFYDSWLASKQPGIAKWAYLQPGQLTLPESELMAIQPKLAKWAYVEPTQLISLKTAITPVVSEKELSFKLVSLKKPIDESLLFGIERPETQQTFMRGKYKLETFFEEGVSKAEEIWKGKMGVDKVKMFTFVEVVPPIEVVPEKFPVLPEIPGTGTKWPLDISMQPGKAKFIFKEIQLPIKEVFTTVSLEIPVKTKSGLMFQKEIQTIFAPTVEKEVEEIVKIEAVRAKAITVAMNLAKEKYVSELVPTERIFSATLLKGLTFIPSFAPSFAFGKMAAVQLEELKEVEMIKPAMVFPLMAQITKLKGIQEIKPGIPSFAPFISITAPKVGMAELLKPAEAFKLEEIIKVKEVQAEAVKQAQLQAIKFPELLRLKEEEVEITKPVEEVPPPPHVPPPILFAAMKARPVVKPKPKLPMAPSYHALVRRYGKWFKVTKKPLTQAEAFKAGAYITSTTAAASFKLEPSKEMPSFPRKKVPLVPAFKFRPSKKEPGVFVEKERYRLEAPQVKREVTYTGLRIANIPGTRKGKKLKGIIGRQRAGRIGLFKDVI